MTRVPFACVVGLLLALPFVGAGAQEREVAIEGPSVIWIPDGRAIFGSTEAEADDAMQMCMRIAQDLGTRLECTRILRPFVFATELPRRRVPTRAFGIDRTEVTRAAWKRCQRAGVCPPARSDPTQADRDDLPVTGITLDDADTFCRFAGGRVPTEEEWERAARGDAGRRYPWGELFNPRLVNGFGSLDGFERLAPVGSFPAARSPYGLLDVAGNAAEWTRGPYGEGPFEGRDVVRGGGYNSFDFALRVASREPRPGIEASPEVGVRCAYSPPSTQVRPGVRW